MTDTGTPIVNPDLSPATITAAETAIITTAAPFIPAKIRAAVYAASGVIVVVAPPIAAVLRGEIGAVLTEVASAAAVAASVLALSHVTK